MTEQAVLGWPGALDSALAAEAEREATRVGYTSFKWYRGVTTHGNVLPFRFARGGSVENFHSALVRFNLVAVTGPFKTRKAASA